MKKINNIFAIFFIICMVSGCNSDKSLLTNKINVNDIDKIQIVSAMGNPEYGAESKIITEKNEIRLLVDSFNNAVIGDKVRDDDVAVSDVSQYYFYSKNTLIQQFSFNGNDSERIWYNSNWYYVNYTDMSPYKLYKSSVAEIIIVDENLKEMKRPPTKISSEQVNFITPDMKYDDIIKLLGDTRDIGSGVYVLEYIVDEDKTLIISLMSKDTPCGKTGEELLKSLTARKVN